MFTTQKGVHSRHICNKEISTSRQHDASPRKQRKPDKELLFQVFSPLSSYHIGKYVSQLRVPWYARASPPISQHLGAIRIGLASIEEVCTRFLFPPVKNSNNKK
jgi:hypothetical protein